MNILEELYYGNIDPFERGFGGNPQCRELGRLVARHEQALTASLSQEQKSAFEKYRDCSQELHRLEELDAFRCGFKLGGQIMLEVAQNQSGIAAE